MDYIHIAKFCTEEEIAHVVPTVRENENTYKFLTFIRVVNGENVGENIYMSKATAEQFETGQVLSTDELKRFSLCLTTNADGEERLKLTVGASSWVDVADLF